MSLKVNADASGIDPTLTKINDTDFLLEIKTDGIELSLQLTRLQVQNLGLQCVQHIPDLEPKFAVESEEDIYRIPAKVINLFTERELQKILREANSADMQQFLWYMKDNKELVDKFLNNMSRRAAEMMKDDIDSQYGGQHPNTAQMGITLNARKSTQSIMKLIQNLQSSGEISTF